MRILLTAVILAAMAALTAFSVTAVGFFDPSDAGGILWCTIGLWALYGLALWSLQKVPARAVVVLVVAGSAVLGGSALAGPPNTSTDSARYAWDGIVQIGGTSPYSYTPADDALAEFRTDWLFPSPVTDADGRPQCEGPRVGRTLSVPSFDVICTTINRPQVNTIYPPAAELYFAGVRLTVPASVEYAPFQIAGALLLIGVTVALVLAMRRRGIDPRWAALWGWSPFVATEAVTNSHVDALAALLLLVATLLLSRAGPGRAFREVRRSVLGGISLGAAIAVKLVPVIGVPAILRRHPFSVTISALLTFAALYVPYILSTGIAVVGYLPGYLSEEGYDDGSRFALLSIVAPGLGALVLAAILLLVTALLVFRFTDPDAPWFGQVVMIGVTMLVVTPSYSWYALLLVPFIALSRRWEWMLVPLALTVQLLVPTLAVARVSFAIAIAGILVVLVLRRRGNGQLNGRSTASNLSAT
ncbi:glycosyltransferase 87 family protein [Subtercola boreus]|uniref:glycosyltransferase 87 family protein n=1 Tax=Subtercola boreus TaxID=120213 RepID=UPI0014755474|nr:glycosyltransferase 87 family protein [Subtercola boreus]